MPRGRSGRPRRQRPRRPRSTCSRGRHSRTGSARSCSRSRVSLSAAAKDARKAVDLESENYENWLILGRIEVERGAAQRGPARRPARAGAAPAGHRVPAGVGPFSRVPGQRTRSRTTRRAPLGFDSAARTAPSHGTRTGTSTRVVLFGAIVRRCSIRPVPSPAGSIATRRLPSIARARSFSTVNSTPARTSPAARRPHALQAARERHAADACRALTWSIERDTQRPATASASTTATLSARSAANGVAAPRSGHRGPERPAQDVQQRRTHVPRAEGHRMSAADEGQTAETQRQHAHRRRRACHPGRLPRLLDEDAHDGRHAQRQRHRQHEAHSAGDPRSDGGSEQQIARGEEADEQARRDSQGLERQAGKPTQDEHHREQARHEGEPVVAAGAPAVANQRRHRAVPAGP